jgi:thiamine biosynthesis lipoprotein
MPILLLLLLLANIARAEPLVIRGATMGTTYQIKIAADPATVDLQRLHADVKTVLAEIDRQMSSWRPDSEVSRFNRAAAGEWFAVSAATAEVAAAAEEISGKTGGALDITVGPLVRLWHFGPDAAGKKGAKRAFVPPTEEAIAAARKLVGYQRLEVRTSPPALRKEIDGLEIDLSSIASGFAIDRLAALIEKRGLENFLVEIGGEVRAVGKRAAGKPWQVAVERPIAGQREMQVALPLVAAAIATAGDYQKFFEYDGKRYSHIIDPATGRPVEHRLASVSVVAESCLAADGWDTPLLVLGPERGFACAEKHDIAALFIVHGDQGDEVRTTAAWREKFGGASP